MIPEGAVREAILAPGDVSVWSVSRLLPRGFGTYRERQPDQEAEAVVVHKSGADGPAGYAGCLGSARFCTAHRRWPGAAYTFWVPREPDEDGDGCLAVYRCHGDRVVSYHTGGRMNRVGVGVGVQGRYDGEWDLVEPGRPRIEREPSKDQWHCLEALADYLEQRYGLCYREDEGSLEGHWEHGKPICPGDALRVWVSKRRGDKVEARPVAGPERPESALVDGVDLQRPSVRDLQRLLAALGHDPGPVDGVLGYRTRAALERAQHEAGVRSDGWYGPETARALGSLWRLRGQS